MSVVIETTIGDITVDLFVDERPVACLNFMKLCKLKYYNYNLFHTIEQGFIAQTGDPTGAGDGGSSIWGVVEGQHKRFFEGETLPKIHHSSAGLISLVGAGKQLLGSQFFFTLGDNLTSLDGQHCVIGEVVEGHETLRKLNEAIVDENFRPYQDIRITHTVILEDPFPDPRGFREPSRSPSPSAERMQNGRIAADEDIDDTDGKTMEEIQEMLAEREAKARATILEIVGDLPDAEMAPPENVLFVCKLNPVTTDDDLEIIFSRFGRVKSCEVIRDRKTGDSLQYAFVEFEDQKACEAAYFKMDNVLIDDRRIHVDFSQSVSRIKWRGKGRGVEGDSKGLDFNNLRDKGHDDRKPFKQKERRSPPRRDNNRQRERRRTRSRSRSRGRMTSAERRKAREERHRELEKQRRSRSRSKSRHRSPPRRDNRRSRSRSKSRHRSPPVRDSRRGERDRSPIRRNNDRHSPKRRQDERYNDRRYDGGQSRHRDRRESPARNIDRRYDDDQRRDRSRRESPVRNSDRTQNGKSVDKKRYESPVRKNSRRDVSPQEESKDIRKRKKEDAKKKSKKSRRDSSSSEESSSSESEEDSSSSSSESESSSSSSEDDRRKKKKSKKSKKKKSKSKKSKPKKHKK
ncbi:peptidyl-prolyl cis-trans isomerase sig-7 [Musca vetustissima]|uniref:peptidyl-prolyl cis-trans isomerase sig-7 n=1 Tax=Musca vetustissima TaxID=27455 RepID=UPI002AB6470A|nr:peptidyl-prolyl cis-trans isomerase sig-7 [Musca vetustissima]